METTRQVSVLLFGRVDGLSVSRSGIGTAAVPTAVRAARAAAHARTTRVPPRWPGRLDRLHCAAMLTLVSCFPDGATVGPPFVVAELAANRLHHAHDLAPPWSASHSSCYSR